MSSFTLVTGLWDIKRGDLTDFNRSFDHYLETFDKLLTLDFNMCIHIPSELKRYVDIRRTPVNTKIYIKELDYFKEKFDFFERANSIRKQESWYTRAGWLEQSPQAKLEYYNPIVMSKFFMLHDSSIFNPFNTEYFFWIDGGLVNTVGIDQLKNLQSIKEYMKSINNKFLFLSYPYENDNEVHGFESRKFSEYCGVDKTTYVCRGGFFGGHREKIKRFNGDYYGIMSSTFSDGYMGTEENFNTILSYNFPEETHRFELENNGLVYKFFDHLSTIEKEETLNNADLIKWNKHKPVEDIKTSLYVLTFNSPDQFETLIKTYEKNDINFLTKTRKILIDNSTNTTMYARYNALCKHYGFEHIKKEENLGICGARQFVAEHFNESDSEYYIFLEDDMNLNDMSDEVCSQGYRRYIDDLYYKSLSIIHKNRYDYLKLSFSEFFGDNSVQWSWYNVPQTVRDKFFPEKTKLPELGLDPDPPKTEIFREKRFKDLKYFEGEFHYCNWPLWFSRQGNKKVFLDTKWTRPFEQTWMSNTFQLQKQNKIRAATLALSPIFHHRFDHYLAEERKES